MTAGGDQRTEASRHFYRTWNVIEGGQRLGAEVDCGRSLPHLLHQDLPLLLLQQLHEELMRRHHKEQRQLLQAFTQSPARLELPQLKDDS